MTNKIRLLIADDHEVVRSGLKNMLADTEIKVVGEVGTGAAAVKFALENEVDVVLLDIRMPDGDGLTALGRIKLDKPNLPDPDSLHLRQSDLRGPRRGAGRQRVSDEGLHARRTGRRASVRPRPAKTLGRATSCAASPALWPRRG